MKTDSYKNFHFEFEALKPAKNQLKKYKVFIQDSQGNKKTLYFGDNRYQHYFDKIGAFSNLNHGDKNRKDAYYSRHGPAEKVQKIGDFTPKWFSHKYLW